MTDPWHPRVLVAAASRHGGTAELAEAVADGVRAGLAGRGEVLVRPCAEGTTVADADAVVLGSGVYLGHWLPAARELVLRCALELQERPVWLFSSGPVGPVGRRRDGAVDVDEVLRLTGAREHRVFGGRLDPALMDWSERAVAVAFGAPLGDFRDPDAAREWGRGIGAAVRGGTPAEPVTS